MNKNQKYFLYGSLSTMLLFIAAVGIYWMFSGKDIASTLIQPIPLSAEDEAVVKNIIAAPASPLTTADQNAAQKIVEKVEVKPLSETEMAFLRQIVGN